VLPCESVRIYLDHNATTPPLPEVVAVIADVLTGDFGNASEWRLGMNYFPKRMRGLRVNGEWINLDDSPVGYTAVPYPVGGNGNVVHVNFELNF